MRARTVLLLVLVGLGLDAVRGYAQELPQKQFINQERMRELEALIPTDQPVQFEWGAWLRSSYYWFDDPPVWRGMRAQDFRLWGSFMLTQHHQFYARGRLTYVDWNSGTSYDGDDSYWDGMNLDVGFYKGAISDAINDLFKIELPFRFETRIGRQFMVLGSGLVYSQINDGLEFTLQGEGWKALVFGSKTISSQRNIDDSIPEVFRDRRSYLGWQIDLTGIDKHTPYVFMLFEEDHQDTPIGIENQRFSYDARYVGAGSQGEVLTFGKGHKMRYFCEGVYQYGHSFLAGSAIETRQISAFALDAGVELLFDLRGKPRLNIEWALGSGDDDRISPTATSYGNTSGKDRNFLYFGYIHTGYSLAPRLSNLGMVRLALSGRPFQGTVDQLDRLELGVDTYWFYKHKRNGGISDSRAINPARQVGFELDLYVNWQVFSDLTITLRQGWFYPGAAYDEGGCRPYFSVDATYSF